MIRYMLDAIVGSVHNLAYVEMGYFIASGRRGAVQSSLTNTTRCDKHDGLIGRGGVLLTAGLVYG